MLQTLLLGLSLLTLRSSSQIISCPVLTCDAELDTDVCFQADETQPINQIRGYSCDTYQLLNSSIPSPVFCDFNL